MFSPMLLKNTENFQCLPFKSTKQVHFPTRIDTEVDNQNIISITYRVYRHRKKI